MMNFKTRVVRDGNRWCVECFRGALGWQRYHFVFGSRSEALNARLWVSQV
jgi:hypothetical protein